jgi:hypothetical protein
MSARLTYASMPEEVKRIGNECLGRGVLRSLFAYDQTYHLMIKVSHGEFIGFALYHFENNRLNGRSYVVGVIDAVCVSTAFRKEGFGTLLTFGVLRKMSGYGVDRVEITMKTPGIDDRDGEPGIPLIGSDELLRGLGFRQVKAFDNTYYAQKSKQFGYDCLLCGNAPDRCQGILYAIDGS